MKRKKTFHRVLGVVLLTTVIALCFSVTISAEPYQNYVYSIEGKAEAEPQAYLPDIKITGEDLGIGAFKQPKNLYVTDKNRIYIVDTGNDRLVVLDENYVYTQSPSDR